MIKNKIWFAAVFMTAFIPRAFAAPVEVSGECVGVKLYTDGLIVCDTVALTERDGTERDIAAEYGIEKGDVITAVGGAAPETNESLIDALASCKGCITLTLRRGEKERTLDIAPADTEDGARLGLWLRDSTAGFGTVTCYVGDRFAALGHGICDVDTGNIMPVSRGIIQESENLFVTKSRMGLPGAISGEIEGEVIGTITDNRENGLFGTTSHHNGTVMETAVKTELRRGEAAILADVDGKGVKEYAAEIKRILPGTDGRDMIIRITDDSLIEKTGGIVQGMSGAPVIQNGKLAGAITHVFLSDARSGYAIAAENLLDGMI